MGGDQDEAKTCTKSVFVVTKDLIEPEATETNKGVDWRWGGDDDDDMTPAKDDEAPASMSDHDTASTAECDSEEEEEEELDSPEWETQPPTDTSPPNADCEPGTTPDSLQQSAELEVSSTHDETSEMPATQPATASEDPKENTENHPFGPTPSDNGHDDSLGEENHNSNDNEPPTVRPSDDSRTAQEEDTAASDSNDGTTEPVPVPPSPENHPDASINDGAASSPQAIRRSMRATKLPKRLQVEESSETTPTTKRGGNKSSFKAPSHPEQEDDAGEPKSVLAKDQQPDEEDLFRSTDFLFVQANKDSVTVADICRALSAEYDCKLSKQSKKRVREHLIDLMKGKVLPQVADPMQEEDHASEPGDIDSDMSDQDQDSHSPTDHDDDEEEQEKPRRVKKSKSKSKQQKPKGKRTKPKMNKKKQSSHSKDPIGEEEDGDDDNKHEDDQISEQGDTLSEQSEFEGDGGSDEDDEEHGPTKAKKNKRNIKSQSKKQPKSTRPPSKQKAAKAARMVEAERLRKKRMEELRIRNEEMQLNQSKEEQERAEAIAAKFETNSDELRLKRIEDRLTLLELLDQKRIAVIDALESKIEATKAAAKSELENPEENHEETKDNDKSDDESDTSSDEEELDIVGVCKPMKPLKPIHTHLPSQALNLLKQVKPPTAKKEQSLSKVKEPNILSSPTQVFKSVASSPTKAAGSRNFLRDFLKQKQRKQGNLWLARELGYKTEEEHLRDCQLAAEDKWALVRKKEQARIEANERKLLRERLLCQDDDAMGGDQDERGDHGSDEEASSENEEDEEMAMARNLEKEAEEMNLEEQVQENQVPLDDTESQNGIEADEDQDATALPQGETMTIGISKSRHVDQGSTSASNDEVSQDDRGKCESSSIDAGKVAIVDDTDANQGPPIDEREEKGEEDNIPESSEEPESTNNGSTKHDDEDDNDEDGEQEFEDSEPKKDPDRPRNMAWQAMLKREAAMLKKQKQKRKQGLVEDQAEEEEEEEVAGLEDFGFSIMKKKQDDDDDEEYDVKLDEDDLEHVVDDVSDGEGDEEAGEEARKRQERLEEKERHREIMRRMREGYDGRRGGIAGSGVGARGVHRFDQLVAADNREDAKRLGLLNDDEIDSEDEAENKQEKVDDAVEDDEAALLDKMLKDRFLHRANVDLEENFSDDEESTEELDSKSVAEDSEAEEERAQERLARRFAKRARMQRLEEEFAESQEFSQQRLIDEDENMRQELSQMKNGLVRSRSVSSSTRSSLSSQDTRSTTIPRLPLSTIGSSFADKKTTSLSIALRASRTTQRRTTFLGGEKSGKTKESGALIHKSVSLSHVVFASANRVPMSNVGGNIGEKRPRVTTGLATGGRLPKVPRTAQ